MARILASNLHGEGIVESKRRPQFQTKTFPVCGFHLLVSSRAITLRLLLEDRGQRCARVLGINIDASSEHSLMADVSARQIKTPLYFQVCVLLDLLRH